jgi:hypothetical protein
MKHLCAFGCFGTWVLECIHEILFDVTTMMCLKLSIFGCLSMLKSSKQQSFDVIETQQDNRKKKKP